MRSISFLRNSCIYFDFSYHYYWCAINRWHKHNTYVHWGVFNSVPPMWCVIPNNSVLDRIYTVIPNNSVLDRIYTDQLVLGQCCQPFLQIDYLGKFWVYLLLMSVEILLLFSACRGFSEDMIIELVPLWSIIWDELEVYFLIWILFFVDICFPHMRVSTQWNFGGGDCSY